VLTNAVAEFENYLARKNISAMELIGRAADTRKSFADMPPKPSNWRNYLPR
jgi:hypothetical protein